MTVTIMRTEMRMFMAALLIRQRFGNLRSVKVKATFEDAKDLHLLSRKGSFMAEKQISSYSWPLTAGPS